MENHESSSAVVATDEVQNNTASRAVSRGGVGAQLKTRTAEDTEESNGQNRHGNGHDGPVPRRRRPMKRLNLNLPETLYNDIEALAVEEGRSMADVLRMGLGLAYLVASERKKGGQFAIVDSAGQLHRIILPY